MLANAPSSGSETTQASSACGANTRYRLLRAKLRLVLHAQVAVAPVFALARIARAPGTPASRAAQSASSHNTSDSRGARGSLSSA